MTLILSASSVVPLWLRYSLFFLCRQKFNPEMFLLPKELLFVTEMDQYVQRKKYKEKRTMCGHTPVLIVQALLPHKKNINQIS